VHVLAGLMNEEGIEHTHVTDPRKLDAALDAITQLDVVFLDLEMPGLNGYEVLEKLKADTRFQGVPVVACTVHISEISVANKQGFDSFIGKPINPDRFSGQLHRILNGEEVWEAT
jgi:two-component system cell cycle response regulator DivK